MDVHQSSLLFNKICKSGKILRKVYLASDLDAVRMCTQHDDGQSTASPSMLLMKLL